MHNPVIKFISMTLKPLKINAMEVKLLRVRSRPKKKGKSYPCVIYIKEAHWYGMQVAVLKLSDYRKLTVGFNKQIRVMKNAEKILKNYY